jgi:hypothetical protein
MTAIARLTFSSLWIYLLYFEQVIAGVITDPTLVSNRTYDYIVAGGGLAGLVVCLVY